MAVHRRRGRAKPFAVPLLVAATGAVILDIDIFRDAPRPHVARGMIFVHVPVGDGQQIVKVLLYCRLRKFARLNVEIDGILDLRFDRVIVTNLARQLVARLPEIGDQLIADFEVGKIPGADK